MQGFRSKAKKERAFLKKGAPKTLASPLWREPSVGDARRANPPYGRTNGIWVKVFCGAFLQKSDRFFDQIARQERL
jgi:hypothetical protein